MRPNSLIRHAATLLIAAIGLAVGASAMAETEAQQKVLEKVSKEGFLAMRDIRWARVGIFDGQIKEAKSLLEHAKSDLAKAEKQAGRMTVTLEVEEPSNAPGGKGTKKIKVGDLIPIDAAVMLAEGFEVKPEKKEAVAKANEHLKKGDVKKAVEVLQAADIGLVVTRTLIPVKATEEAVDKAIGLIGQQKYYEANLALKEAEDGAVINTAVAYEGPPKSAAKQNAAEPEKKTEAAPEKK
jgi:hypothetical protein